MQHHEATHFSIQCPGLIAISVIFKVLIHQPSPRKISLPEAQHKSIRHVKSLFYTTASQQAAKPSTASSGLEDILPHAFINNNNKPLWCIPTFNATNY